MKKPGKSVAWPLLAALLAVSPAWGAPKTARIQYAEPVIVSGLPALASPGPQKPGAARARIDAFGRRFDLQLESNEQVLRKLPSTQRAVLPAHALYGGEVAGLPGSWVRLTRLEDGIHGLIFDGAELYVVAPAGAVQGQLDTPLAGLGPGANVIYRAADTDGDLGPNFCRVLEAPGGNGVTGAAAAKPAYQAIFAELQAQAPQIGAALASKELDLAMIGDTFLAAQFASPTGEMLARLNNIDGIFSAQVGVKVVSGFVKVLTDSGGMTSTDAGTLLDQFESLRRVTPEAAARGLSHLMTGRELDGSTIGIAYIGTVCAPQFSVSLSQTYLDTFYSSLVAAHELGHNFGSPHDGVSGACAATPQTFLMSPSINGSSSFSACSLTQMSPYVSGAACLKPINVVDTGVEFPAASVAGYWRQDLHVGVDVTSNGTIAASNVALSLTSDNQLSIVGVNLPGAACTSGASNWTCTIDSMAPGTRASADVTVRGDALGKSHVIANLSTAGDAVADNNSGTVTVTLTNGADATLSASAATFDMYAGQSRAFSFTVSNPGPLALDAAVLTISPPVNLSITSVTGTGATCTSGAAGTTCALGSVAAGATRKVDVAFTALRLTQESIGAQVQSPTDANSGNNATGVFVQARPVEELTLAATQATATIPLGGTITQSFTLASIGTQAVNDARIDFAASGADVVSIAGAGAQCGQLPTSAYRCTYADPIAAGEQRRVDVQLRGTASGTASLSAFLFAPDNQHLPGTYSDSITLNYKVQADVDVQIRAPNTTSTVDHQPVELSYLLESVGATPAANSRITLTLPAGLRATAAQAGNGSCSIGSTAVTCSVGTLNFGATAIVTVSVAADVPAVYFISSQATADSDKNAANGASVTSVDVRANIDASVSPPTTTQHVRQAGTVEQTVTIAAATQPLANVALFIGTSGTVTVTQATPSQGTCSAAQNGYNCAVGAIPAGGSATLALRIRGDVLGAGWVTVTATANGDWNGNNNMGTLNVIVDQRGDVAVAQPGAVPAATVGTSFNLPRIVVSAVTPTDDVRATVTVPAAFSIVSATADSAPCSVDAGSISCSFGSLPADASRGINVQLRPNQAGSFSVDVRATAADDADPSNNARTLQFTVAAAPAGGGGSSGGGGGAFGGESLLMLLMLTPALARRRRAGGR